MSQWKSYIVQIKELLEQINLELAPYWDNISLKEKQAQLQSIENSIAQLQKGNIPIPNELRELKFKLLKQIDSFSEADRVKNEIRTLFEPYMRQVKRRKRNLQQEKIRKKPENRVILMDIINAGIISVPLSLIKNYLGITYHATITVNGKIEIMKNGNLEIYDSPSSAATAYRKKNTNGWTWWLVEHESGYVELDYFRKKFESARNK
jgi:Skp family chaperone for outer membrane proteins